MHALATSRLRGRPVAADDAPFLARLFGDPAIARWTGEGGRPWSAGRAGAGAAAFAAHWTAHRFGLRVWDGAEGPQVLAGLQFCVIDGRAEVEASFAVLSAAQGRGLAGEAMTAVIAEDAPDVARHIAAVVREGNAPALALLARLGFAPAGRAAGARLLRRAGGERRGAGDRQVQRLIGPGARRP